MCGICGVFGAPNEVAVNSMIYAMRHRGPDSSGIFSDNRITLGMTRLSIIDLSKAGSQPMSNPDKSVWIVYNGEMYNYLEERKILEGKGFSFHSNSDTEVVLRLYEYYGESFLERMQGMFALAIWDKRPGEGREILTIARDHFGLKPLYYTELSGQLLFASEIKALLASRLFDAQINPDGLRQLLQYGSVYCPNTILNGVNILPPAHKMVIQGDYSPRIVRYWSIGVDRIEGLRHKPYDEQVEQVSEALEKSITKQLVSDVPLGVFLSGGLDSSLLTAFMAKQHGASIKTFSIGFEREGKEMDETDLASETATFLGTDHSRIVVTGKDIRSRIKHIAYSLDQPSVDGVNSYFVSLAAKQAVTVALSGTGGDELFAGYPWFHRMLQFEQWVHDHPISSIRKRLISRSLQASLFDQIVRTRLGNLLVRARSAGSFLAQYSTCYNIFGEKGSASTISPELRSSAHAGRSAYYDLYGIDEIPNTSPIERVSALCLRGYTSNQLLRDLDAVSMSHSLEVRAPYLDHKLLDLALSLPYEAKVPHMGQMHVSTCPDSYDKGLKRILYDIGKPLLPDSIGRRRKRGFSMPFGAWLKGPLKDIMEDALSEESVRKRGLLVPGVVTGIKNDFLAGRKTWAQPWLLMMLELWCREVLDNSINSAAQDT